MIRFRNVSFAYSRTSSWVIQNATFGIAQGSFCLVCGASGSGKSTLLRLMNGLVPHFSGGLVRGEITVNGKNPIHAGPAAMSSQIGFVFQDPETQFLLDNVEDEMAFNLENAAVPPRQIAQRIDQTLQILGISHLKRRRLESLSGGEKQKVAIATVLCLTPSILILDEPTSQLDSQSAAEILSLIQQLAQQRERTILVAEHRLDRLLHYIDRLIYLPGGEMPPLVGNPRQILRYVDIAPPVVQLAKRLNYHPLPLSVSEGKAMLQKLGVEHLNQRDRKAPRQENPSQQSSPTLSLEQVTVSYGKNQALAGVSLDLFSSQITCLMGPNGAGKTTLLRAILGLGPPYQGRIRLLGEDLAALPTWKRSRRIGYLPQDPNALLFAETVLEELLLTLRNHALPQEGEKAEALLMHLGLSENAHRYPRDLSVGERQRVALAAILITEPQVLLLDEPTRGLDEQAKANLATLLKRCKANGMTIFLVTHDVEFMLPLADRLCVLVQGKLIADGSPHAVLRKTGLPAAQLSQLFPEQNFRHWDEAWQAIDAALSHKPDKSDQRAALVCRNDDNKLPPQE